MSARPPLTLKAIEPRSANVIELASGNSIDVDRPDFSKIKTVEDFLDLRYALQEKIIDIELQIDLFTSGAGVLMGRSYRVGWLPLAQAALKWAKLYRDECQNRQSLLTKAERVSAQAELGQQFIACARAILDQETFAEILAAANTGRPK